MSAPESETRLEIVPEIPSELVGARRALAAIVFTDTVNYSVLMSRNEERTLELVARDLAQMKALCAEYGGQVLKSTGDGLLMLFTSVVESVACSLEIQRRFLERNRTVPSSEQLQHRIGIHLGDVFQQGGDVMGDGVNIAARLQAESRAGGVCLSNTVYDVVQNRIPLVVTSRGPRKLKNVGTVIAYQIFPINSRYRYVAFFMRWGLSGEKRRYRRIALGLTIASFFISFAYWRGHQAEDDGMDDVSAQLGPLGPPSLLWEHGGVPLLEMDAADYDDDDVKPRAFPAPGKAAATAEDFSTARFNDMKSYDFAAMVLWLQKNDTRGAQEDKMSEICQAMAGLSDWCHLQLRTYSAQAPLYIHDELNQQDGLSIKFGSAAKDEDDGHDDTAAINMEIWPDAAGNLVFRQGTRQTILPWDQIAPPTLAQILLRVIQDRAMPHAPDTSKLWCALRYFVVTYQVKASPHWRRELHRLSKPTSPVGGNS